jgi:hypothetical protein
VVTITSRAKCLVEPVSASQERAIVITLRLTLANGPAQPIVRAAGYDVSSTSSGEAAIPGMNAIGSIDEIVPVVREWLHGLAAAGPESW